MSVSWRVVVLVDWMGSLIRVGSAFHGKWSVCNSLWRLATNTNAMTYCIPSRNQNCLQESLNYLPTTIVAPTNFERHTCNAGLYCALSLSLYSTFFFFCPSWILHSHNAPCQILYMFSSFLRHPKIAKSLQQNQCLSMIQLGVQAHDPTGSEGAEYLKPRKTFESRKRMVCCL